MEQRINRIRTEIEPEKQPLNIYREQRINMHQTDNVTKNQNQIYSKVNVKNQEKDNQYRITNASKMTTEELIGAIRKKLKEIL